MTTRTHMNSELTVGRRRSGRRHTLPSCQATGLARYRDRHQARHGSEALAAGAGTFKVSTFACPDCRGFHLEKTYPRRAVGVCEPFGPIEASMPTLSSGLRRYVLVDVENLTLGARATPEELAALWSVLRSRAPGIARDDHVVVGASRAVVRKYCTAMHGAKVRWVVGADAPDAADRALLAAINVRRVARDYDELVIASGDHAFVDLARRAKSHGLSVHVVTAEHPEQRSMLSRELATLADTRTLVRTPSYTSARDTIARIEAVARASQRIFPIDAVAA